MGAAAPFQRPAAAPAHLLLYLGGRVSVAVYSRVVQLAPLTDTHRKELREKRGFTDAVIDACKFRSCGPHFNGIIDAMKAEFQQSDLVESGVLTEALDPSTQLLRENVLIP